METSKIQRIKEVLKSNRIQKSMILIITLVMSFCIVFSGAMPKKYKLNLGDVSEYDITAPREIQNRVKTRENQENAYEQELPDMKEDTATTIEVISSIDDFLSIIKNERSTTRPSLTRVVKELQDNKLLFVDESDVKYLLTSIDSNTYNTFEHSLKQVVSDAMKEDITAENLGEVIIGTQLKIQKLDMGQQLKNIGSLIASNILKPNRIINEEATLKKREIAYNNPKNIEIVEKGQRILSVGDTVTEDKLGLLEDLNMLDTQDNIDYELMLGIFAVLILLTILLIAYIKRYVPHLLKKPRELAMIAIIMVMELLIARILADYQILIVPVFFVGITISILLDVGLALILNLILAVAISFITRGNLEYMYITLISGSLVCFFCSRANQRNKLATVGFFSSIINVIVVLTLGMINKKSASQKAVESLWAFGNGIVSIILTIGILPFLETVFNVITPMRLLELSNPNEPLLKKLMLEAPGTYHHSLMVGNLAEAAAEVVGGNPLLARVGAYYHDIGKLKRPNFFIENQSGENPHDRMSPNLSALVITSHAYDGAQLAKKYKLPTPIIDLIIEHHGTTKLVYFYHKAQKLEREEVKEENFRYQGPKPGTKEAAVVMLADSVEAAVRSMTDKTEGKIEGYIRKIIKDKLDDGQFDLCNLTLRDMDNIAKAFMKVLSGCFHEREEYPQQKTRQTTSTESGIIKEKGEENLNENNN